MARVLDPPIASGRLDHRASVPTEVVVVPQRVVRMLSMLAVGLVLASVAGQVAKFCFGHDRLGGFVPAFNLDRESNIPSWYSTSLLLLSAALFGIAAQAAWNIRDRFARHWSGLSLLFVGFSMDELAGIHEHMIHPLRTLVGASGIFHYAWVIAGMALVLFVAAVSATFLRALDAPTRRRLLVAGVMYVTGALALEMVGGAYASQFGVETPAYAVLTTLEEGLEMAGLIMLIHALLLYLAAHNDCVRFIRQHPQRT